MSPERISAEEVSSSHGHLERYRWATDYIGATDTVLDIACGIGYGAPILMETGCCYIGVDKPGVVEIPADGATFYAEDIDTWIRIVRL